MLCSDGRGFGRVLLTIGMEVLLPDLEQNQKYLREMIYF